MAKSEDQQEGRSGGGEEEPEERTDGWMTTYADMVTLLMTFFVLMFAISNVDQQKAALFFAGLSAEGLSIENYQYIVNKYGPAKEDDGDLIPQPSDVDGPVSQVMAALAAKIGFYIDENGLGDKIALEFDGEFLLLTLASDIWFVSGSAEITDEMRERAVDLADLLRANFNPEQPYEVVVAGHTDDVPIHTVRYPSNWHVSKDRATNFLEILITETKGQIDPSYFYARACGEYRPRATNETPEGRQLNRRVEVMISLSREDDRWRELETSVTPYNSADTNNIVTPDTDADAAA